MSFSIHIHYSDPTLYQYPPEGSQEMQYLCYFFQTLSDKNLLENYNYFFRMQYLYDNIVIYPPLISADTVLMIYSSNEGNDKKMKKKNSTQPSLRELILLCLYHI